MQAVEVGIDCEHETHTRRRVWCDAIGHTAQPVIRGDNEGEAPSAHVSELMLSICRRWHMPAMAQAHVAPTSSLVVHLEQPPQIRLFDELHRGDQLVVRRRELGAQVILNVGIVRHLWSAVRELVG